MTHRLIRSRQMARALTTFRKIFGSFTLTAILGAVALTDTAHAAVTFVQTNNAVPQTPQVSVTVPFTAAQTAGNLNVVVVGWSDSTSHIISVTDTQGNTYTRAVGPTVQTGIATQAIYYSAGIAAAAPGANSVTVTFDAAARYVDMRIAEYSGIDAANPVDVVAAASGNSATSNSGSVTTTHPTTLLVGANLVQTATWTAGPNFTARVITIPDGDILQDRVVTSVGTYSSTALLTNAGPWIMQLVAFRAAPESDDTTPPSAPSALTATVVSSAQIDLSWTASDDDVGVTEYRIERCVGAGCSNFTQIDATSATAYSDTGLSAATSYTYRVRAVDAASNLSAYSNLASGTTPANPDIVAPSAPGALSATAVSTGQINLSWTGSTDNVGVVEYLIERCQGAGCSSFSQIGTAAGTSYSNTGLSPSTSYSYRVRARDAANNHSEYSNIASATTQAPDSTSIAYVQGSSATPNLRLTSVSATFPAPQTAGNTNIVIVGYSSSTPVIQSITDTQGNTYHLAVGPIYQIGVAAQAIYYATNIAAGPNTVTATFSTGAPYVDLRIAEYSGIDPVNPVEAVAESMGYDGLSDSGPLTVTSANALIVAGNIGQSATAGPGPGFTSRMITPHGDIFEDRIVGPGTYNATAPMTSPYWWVMQAVAFRAAPSGPPDTEAPTAPSGLNATATSSSQINLSWTASQDNVGVTQYRVERCQGAGCSTFSEIGTATGTTFNDTGLAGSTSYSYRVRAVDAATNFSDYSNVATATTPAPPDTQPPTAPSGLIATVVSTSQINLSWTESTDNVGVVNYQVERCQGATCSNFSLVDATAGNTYSDNTLLPSTTYRYRVRALDAAGNPSGYSNIASGTTQAVPDTEPPSAPTGLNAAALSTTEISLSWGASSDNVGVTSYLIERCEGDTCSNFTQIDSTPATSYTDSGLTPATLYKYRVRATDAAANLSAYSDVAVAPTHEPDTQPPTPPVWLAASAISTDRIDLSWSAASDDIGVTGYLIERCEGLACSDFVQIATTSQLVYSDTGLTPSTAYSYRVRATDAAENLGDYSNVASATTEEPAAGTIEYVQGASATPNLRLTSVSATFPSAQTAGNFNVVIVGYSSSTPEIQTVKDSRGNVYQLAVGPIYQQGVAAQAIYYASNIKAGTNTVTVTFSTGAPYVDLRIAEYSGINPINPVEAVAEFMGYDGLSDSGPLTVTSANALIVAGNIGQSATAGPGPGFTSRMITPHGDIFEDRIVGPGTYNATAPMTSPYWWVMQAVAFRGKPAGGGDIQPPTAPSSLVATTVSSSQIDLVWAASTDDVAVTNYLIERCQGVGCNNYAQIGTSTGTTFSDVELTPSTAYRYRVRAQDAANNVSGYSNSATATTLGAGDTEAPTAPSNLQATAASTTQINLTWGASTDNIGVTAYLIERCQGVGCADFAQVGTSSTNSFTADNAYKGPYVS